MDAEVTILIRDTSSAKAAPVRARVINFQQVSAQQVTELTGAYAEHAAAALVDGTPSNHANEVLAREAQNTLY